MGIETGDVTVPMRPWKGLQKTTEIMFHVCEIHLIQVDNIDAGIPTVVDLLLFSKNEMLEEGKKMIMDNVPQKKDGYIKVKSVL